MQRSIYPGTSQGAAEPGQPVSVFIDGNVLPVPVVNIAAVAVSAGDRVMVDFVGQSGAAYIIGFAATPAAAAGWVPMDPPLTVDQGTNTEIAHTINFSEKFVTGQHIHVRASLTMTAAGDGPNIISLNDLPSTVDVDSISGTFRYADAGGTPANYFGHAWSQVDGVVKFMIDGATNSFGVSDIGSIASTDVLYTDITYKLAG